MELHSNYPRGEPVSGSQLSGCGCGQKVIFLVVWSSSCAQLQAKVIPQSPGLGNQHLAMMELPMALETFQCPQRQSAECER